MFVLPSRQEPFGIVLLEAGLCKLPVVATKVGGIPEIITDGETGWLVPPGDPTALADAMRAALSFTEQSEKVARRLHARVMKQFSWKVAYRKYIEAGGPQLSNSKEKRERAILEIEPNEMAL